jgi:hypothetical protein
MSCDTLAMREGVKNMSTLESFEETCENCRFLTADDLCGQPLSPYHGRPMVYRDGDEVLQTGWCDHWKGRADGAKSG